MIALLDANVLIAVTAEDHVHHDVAEAWLQRWEGTFATCPVTQGALVRFVLRGGGTATDAATLVRGLQESSRHEFWEDTLGYDRVDLRGVVGHRQVTDAYLASAARSRGAALATLDRGLAALHGDVAVLVISAVQSP